MENLKYLIDFASNKKLLFPKNFNFKKFYLQLKRNELNYAFFSSIKNNINLQKKFSAYKKDMDELVSFFKGINYFSKLLKKSDFSQKVTLIKLKDVVKAHSDLDVLCPDNFKQLSKLLFKEGFEVKDSIGYELSLKKQIAKRPFVVDLHNNIKYNNSSFIDKLALSKGIIFRKINGSTFKYVSRENDFLITVVHSFFQKIGVKRILGFNSFRWSELTLSDLVQMKNTVEEENFNFDYVREKSLFFGWGLALAYSLVVLDCFLPSQKIKKIISKLNLDKNILKKYYADVKSNFSLPFYSSIRLTYFVCLHKLKKEFSLGFFSGLKYFWNMHRWFAVNILRIIKNKLLNKNESFDV